MSRPDPEQLDRDQLVTERALERDAHGEPAHQHRHPRCIRPSPLAERRRWQASMQDAVNEAKAAAERSVTMHLICPACRGPAFAPRDSDREVITCADPTCDAMLVTRRTVDGVELQLVSGSSLRGGAP